VQRQIIPDLWQKRILETEGHILLCTGRQVGKTTIFARKAAKRMIDKAGSRIITVSLTEDQAKLIIVMVLDYLEQHNPRDIATGKNKPTQNKVVLKNGSQILARPVGNTGDAVRGFTGDVLYLDEASRMPELVFTAGKPTLLTTAGEIWISSTPKGKQGYFWEAFQNKNKRYTVFHISSEEVIKNRPINVGWTEKQRIEGLKVLEEERKEMSVLQYGQEYLGLFLDDLRRYFSDELIEKTCTLIRRKERLKDRAYYLGVDIARLGGDEITFEIVDRIDEKNIEQVENRTATKKMTTWTEKQIITLNEEYDELKKIYIDAGAGSLGVGILDYLLKNDELKRKVVAINNRTRVMDKDGKSKQRILKEDLYDNLRSLMEKGWIKLLNDTDLKASLRSVQYEYQEGANKLTRFRIFGDYTHIAEGLIRAAWSSKDKNLNMFIDFV